MQDHRHAQCSRCKLTPSQHTVTGKLTHLTKSIVSTSVASHPFVFSGATKG